MHHNAQRPGAYFQIPSAQIMEIGIEFEIRASIPTRFKDRKSLNSSTS